MRTNYTALLLIAALCSALPIVQAQEKQSLTLEQAKATALENNRLLKIKTLQVAEKRARVKEDNIKKYPSVTVNSTYQYNVNLGQLTIPEGSVGVLPLSPTLNIPLPDKELKFDLGEHHTFNAGATIYQPITQQGKIKTGIAIAEAEVRISEKEKEKAAQQITLNVEKLYYALLINQKQQEEAEARLELARIKLYDVESALLSGKTLEASKSGLEATTADEEQKLLKLQIAEDDYTTDLKSLTGLTANEFELAPVAVGEIELASLETYKTAATANNIDLNLAELTKEKAELGIKAAKQSYLPDLGLIAGYTYQTGNILYPTNNPFAGVNLKWNLQEIISNRQLLNQRNFLLQQALENSAYLQEQTDSNLEKAYRKSAQAKALIKAAEKVVRYRKEDLTVQQDRNFAGLNKRADVLEAQSELAKAMADLYAAQLNALLVRTDLKMLSTPE